MPRHRIALAAALVAAALLGSVVALVVASDPYRLVRADFARQRIAAGLSSAQVQLPAPGASPTKGDRWSYAFSDAAPAGAPTLVLLHGFTGSKENWYPVARYLRSRYRLLIPDLPGWGASERRAGADYGFTAQAERVAGFIDQVARRDGSPVVLVGHSMGGGIAALVAARHPGAVDRLGLLDAAGVRFKDNRFGREVLDGRNPFAVDDRAGLERYLSTVFFDARARPWIPWPVDAVYIARRRQDAAFEQAVLDRIGRGDARFLPGDEAAAITQPTLLLWCRQDAVIDPSAMALYAQRIPQARQVLLDGCGHMSLMEQPDAVAAALVSLIERGQSR